MANKENKKLKKGWLNPANFLHFDKPKADIDLVEIERMQRIEDYKNKKRSK